MGVGSVRMQESMGAGKRTSQSVGLQSVASGEMLRRRRGGESESFERAEGF